MIRKLICRYWYRRHKWKPIVKNGVVMMLLSNGKMHSGPYKQCRFCNETVAVKRRKAKGEV